MEQTHLKTYYDAIGTIDMKCDLSDVVTMLQTAIAEDETAGKDLVYQVAKMLKGLGITDCSNYFDHKDDSCFYTTFTKDDRELKWLIDTIGKVPYTDETGEGEGSAADDSLKLEEQGYFHALSGNDVTYGSDEDDSFAMCSGDDFVDAGDGNDIVDTHGGNDTVFGGAGNDTIHTSDGDDIIFGGAGDDMIYPDLEGEVEESERVYGMGNDTIRGGTGNDTVYSVLGDDTFIFNLGDGQDVVTEKQGIDTFYFGNGISWSNLIFTQSDNDMVIKIENTTDQITVKDWFTSSEDGQYHYDNNKIEIFEFADGTKYFKDDITTGDNTESIVYNINNQCLKQAA